MVIIIIVSMLLDPIIIKINLFQLKLKSFITINDLYLKNFKIIKKNQFRIIKIITNQIRKIKMHRLLIFLKIFNSKNNLKNN